MYLFTAIKWFFKILVNGEAAFQTTAAPTFATSSEPAIQMLALLQKEGRFVDFAQENIGAYGDADIGAAVREMHRGWQKALHSSMKITRVVDAAEGSAFELPEPLDASKIELRGQSLETGAKSGKLIHGGWYCEELKLPTVPAEADPRVIAPAQVEI